MRSIKFSLLLVALLAFSCKTPQYGREQTLTIKTRVRPVWAIAPAINLSGQSQVDPLLQADLVYEQLQAVKNITVIPVNRVVQVYAALNIDKVQSEAQATLVCQELGCDGLLIPTVTAFDPYDPPKFGAAMQLLGRPGGMYHHNIDPRELARRSKPSEDQLLPRRPDFLQVVGMYDAANGSVRDAVYIYAKGRNDPKGPLGISEYFVSMDRYCGFVYHDLLADLIRQAEQREAETQNEAVASARVQ